MQIISYLLIFFFILGGLLMLLINKKKSSQEKKQSFTKYYVYLFVTIPILISINYSMLTFRMICLLIISIGFYELISTSQKTTKKPNYFTLLFFSLFAFLFFKFSFLTKEIQLFTYILVIVFDGFSQIIGQLFGSIKMASKISPNKTLEGFFGGLTFAFITSILVYKNLSISLNKVLILTPIIVVSSLVGDLLASLYKRKYKIKDYSNLIPQHGGFLDRFDSFIFSGAMVFLIANLIL